MKNNIFLITTSVLIYSMGLGLQFGCGQTGHMVEPETSPSFKDDKLNVVLTPEDLSVNSESKVTFDFVPLYEGKGNWRISMKKIIAGVYDSVLIEAPFSETQCHGCASSAGFPPGYFEFNNSINFEFNKQYQEDVILKFTSAGEYDFTLVVEYDSIFVGEDWHARGSGYQNPETLEYVSMSYGHSFNINVKE